MLRLPWARNANHIADSGPSGTNAERGPKPRTRSPVGGSTIVTSAPSPASIIVP